MSVKSSSQISRGLAEQYKEVQANPQAVFGIANFGPAWPHLNGLSRGLQRKTFTVLMARQKVGKSMLISQWVPEFALQAKAVGKVLRIVTLETTMDTYHMRTAAKLAAIQNPMRIREGTLTKPERLRYFQALKDLDSLPIEYLSNEYDLSEEEDEEKSRIGSGSIGMQEVEGFIRQPDTFLWIIDHMGLIRRQNTGKGANEQLAAIADQLTYISNRFVGGIGITHLNRSSIDGGPPGFENIAGTDVFGRNAGALYWLWRPYYEARSHSAEDEEMEEALGGDHGLLIFKSRNEGNGTVGVFWSKSYAGFTETDLREGNIPMPGQGRRAATRQPPATGHQPPGPERGRDGARTGRTEGS
jgi:DnaB-like helicase C terminal domain